MSTVSTTTKGLPSILLPACVAFLLYVLTFDHGFVLDDNLVITSNSHVQDGFAGIGDLFKYNYAHGHQNFNDGLYRPLSLVSFAAEKSLFNLSPTASHLIQALLYAICVLLLTLWLRQLFGKDSSWPFWIALLFAVHPIHTEVAANLKSRDEILALLFFAGAAWSFTRWLRTKDIKQLALASCWFLGATFSKESAITFIALFPLIAWYLNIDSKRIITGTAVMLIPVGLFLIVRQSVLSSLGPVDSGVANLLQNSLMEIGGITERIATAASIQGLYIQKLFFPVQLSHDYSYNAIEVVGLSSLSGLFWIVVNSILIGAGIVGLVKRKWWSFGILFYYITIAVVANLFILIGAIAAERFVFTPSLGWCIAIVAGIGLVKLNEKRTNLVLAGVTVVFALLTAMRIPDWKSNYTLFTTDVEVVPNSARAHYNAGSAMIDEAKADPRQAAKLTGGAQEHLRKAIEIWPDYQDAYNNLGISYMNSKNFEAAYTIFKEFMKLFPEYVKVRYNMGVTCNQLQRYDESERYFEQYLVAHPNTPDAVYFAAEAEGFQQKFGEAIEHLNALILLEPQQDRGHLKLGMAYGITGNINGAEKHLQKAVEINPNNADNRFNLAVMYLNSNRPELAAEQARIILSQNPNHERAKQLLTGTGG